MGRLAIYTRNFHPKSRKAAEGEILLAIWDGWAHMKNLPQARIQTATKGKFYLSHERQHNTGSTSQQTGVGLNEGSFSNANCWLLHVNS